MDVLGYQNLITSEHRDKPKFIAMVGFGVDASVTIQNLLTRMMTTLFDLDLAVGDQLDIIGEWVGVTRNVSIPSDGIYFSWDSGDFIGWDFGSWANDNQPGTVTTLPDDAYRTLVKARIAANHWDGTTEGAYAVWDALFTQFTILIQDNQNMSYALIVAGGIVDALTLALLTGGYIPLKPEGVRVSEYIVQVDTNPLFGWDIDTDLVQGWDAGSWGRVVAPA